MTITLTPEIEHALIEQARKQETTLDDLVLTALREKYDLPTPKSAQAFPFEPRDEWEKRLLDLGKSYGVSLSDEAVSSEGIYG